MHVIIAVLVAFGDPLHKPRDTQYPNESHVVSQPETQCRIGEKHVFLGLMFIDKRGKILNMSKIRAFPLVLSRVAVIRQLRHSTNAYFENGWNIPRRKSGCPGTVHVLWLAV